MGKNNKEIKIGLLVDIKITASLEAYNYLNFLVDRGFAGKIDTTNGPDSRQ